MAYPHPMPAPKSTASSLLSAGLGIVGFSALAGLLAAVMVAPAVAVGGITTNNTVGIFDSLPDYITLSQQREANEIVATNPDGSDFHIATVFDQNRQSVALDQMSDYLKQAAVAGEDRRYYQHGGIDIPSVARAALGQVQGSSDSGGASTIAMQLVRNIRFQEASALPAGAARDAAVKAAVYPDLGRKVQEMKLAIGLEKKYSKQQILAGYLNIVGMGGNTYGVEAAAEQYYSSTAANLTPAQAASLIAIVQNPSANGLFSDKNYAANEARRNVILGFMEGEGYITQAQYLEAKNTPVASYIKYSAPKQGCQNATAGFSFVCELAVQYLTSTDTVPSLGAGADAQKERWKQGGLKVYVSVQPTLQDQANQIVQKYVPPTESRFAFGAAETTVQTGTGRILVMAQNKPFGIGTAADASLSNLDRAKLPYSSYNFNVDPSLGGAGGFQPGSTYKPYTLLNFLAHGHGINEAFNASVRNFNQAKFTDSCPDANGGWGGSFPVRNDENESGSYTAARGTARSVNSVFVQMGLKVDQCDTQKIASSLGLFAATKVKQPDTGKYTNDLITRPSCIIGGCENNITPLMQAGAYAAIANGGVYCTPILIDKIEDQDGTVLPGQSANCAQDPLITPDVANTAAYAMAGVFAGSGTAYAANPGDGTAYIGKTGTTDNSIHTWTVGSSTKASTALWVGNIVGEDGAGGQPLRKISVGGINAASIRNNVFKATARAIDAFPGLKGDKFPAPAQQLLDGAKATVPSGLIGGSVPAAQAALDAAGLTYQDGGQVDSDLPAGTVASVDPGEGTQVVQGAFVTVYTSNGLAQPVPTVTGQSESDAKNALKAAGFNSVTTQCVQWTGPTDPDAGKVVQQSPSGGSSANPANPVTIAVKQPHC